MADIIGWGAWWTVPLVVLIGLSLPEMVILRKVLKLPLIITFATVVGVGIIAVGYLFNLVV